MTYRTAFTRKAFEFYERFIPNRLSLKLVNRMRVGCVKCVYDTRRDARVRDSKRFVYAVTDHHCPTCIIYTPTIITHIA